MEANMCIYISNRRWTSNSIAAKWRYIGLDIGHEDKEVVHRALCMKVLGNNKQTLTICSYERRL